MNHLFETIAPADVITLLASDIAGLVTPYALYPIAFSNAPWLELPMCHIFERKMLIKELLPKDYCISSGRVCHHSGVGPELPHCRS